MYLVLGKNETVPKTRSVTFFKGIPHNPVLSQLKQGLCTPRSRKMHIPDVQSRQTHSLPYSAQRNLPDSQADPHTQRCCSVYSRFQGCITYNVCLYVSVRDSGEQPPLQPPLTPFTPNHNTAPSSITKVPDKSRVTGQKLEAPAENTLA